MLSAIRRAWKHRGCVKLPDGRCSIYSPCRAGDLKSSWEDFQRRVTDPSTGPAMAAAEMRRIITERRDLDGKRR
jgi:hypothetical protein